MALVELPDDILEAVRARSGATDLAGPLAELLRAELARTSTPTVARDALTGAWTRPALRERLAAGLAAATPYRERFLCLDLDDFQRFLDAEGQPRGDGVLRQLVRDLQALYGKDDVYRLGNDDLVVVLGERSAWRPGTPPGAALKYAVVSVALRANRKRQHHLQGWIELHLARGLLTAKPEGAQVECREPPGLPPP